MNISAFSDCIRFSIQNANGFTLESDYWLNNISCFKELSSYERLVDMPTQDLKRLSARMYELLFTELDDGNIRYEIEPKINTKDPNYQQILREMIVMQNTQRRLIASGKIVLP